MILTNEIVQNKQIINYIYDSTGPSQNVFQLKNVANFYAQPK